MTDARATRLLDPADHVVGACHCIACRSDVVLVAEVEDVSAPPQLRTYGPATGECCGRLYLVQPDGRVSVHVLDAEAAAVWEGA